MKSFKDNSFKRSVKLVDLKLVEKNDYPLSPLIYFPKDTDLSFTMIKNFDNHLLVYSHDERNFYIVTPDTSENSFKSLTGTFRQ